MERKVNAIGAGCIESIAPDKIRRYTIRTLFAKLTTRDKLPQSVQLPVRLVGSMDMGSRSRERKEIESSACGWLRPPFHNRDAYRIFCWAWPSFRSAAWEIASSSELRIRVFSLCNERCPRYTYRERSTFRTPARRIIRLPGLMTFTQQRGAIDAHRPGGQTHASHGSHQATGSRGASSRVEQALRVVRHWVEPRGCAR